MLRTTMLALCCGVLALSGAAADDTLVDSLEKGKIDLNIRYRLEYVDQEDFTDNANANTIRLRLGYTSKLFHGFYFNAEAQGNWSITNDYNSTANGQTAYPVVADPQDSNFSGLSIAYRLFEKTDFKLGRTRTNLDNQRFIGSVGWRQLEQSYDGLSVTSKHFEKFTLYYAWVGEVVRVFGEHNPSSTLARSDQNSHLLNASWDSGVGTVTGYVYLLDFVDAPSISHKDLGVRFAGKHDFDSWNLVYEAEYANQSEFADGDSTIDASYAHAMFGVGCKWATVKLGYELLGGDGTWAFQTPFATLHKFNGWADKFLVTPDDGLKDAYLSVTGSAKGIRWGAIYHDFTPDTGSAGYGQELNLLVAKTWKKKYTVGAKYANYSADSSATGFQAIDVSKFWLWLQFNMP